MYRTSVLLTVPAAQQYSGSPTYYTSQIEHPLRERLPWDVQSLLSRCCPVDPNWTPAYRWLTCPMLTTPRNRAFGNIRRALAARVAIVAACRKSDAHHERMRALRNPFPAVALETSRSYAAQKLSEQRGPTIDGAA